MEDNKYTCSICHLEFTGYGNNAYPVNEGTCCDYCNYNVVIPARLNKLSNKEGK